MRTRSQGWILPLLFFVEAALGQADFKVAVSTGSSPGGTILPVWTRQDIWMPWGYWDAEPPVFESYMKEAALVMATGYRPENNFEAPDLYQENPDGSMKPFSSSHYFFGALAKLKAAGIKPYIDIGPVPRALSNGSATRMSKAFFYSVEAPKSANYEKYYLYVKALFFFLQGKDANGTALASPTVKYTLSELNSWRFQLGREPDNIYSFNPANLPATVDKDLVQNFNNAPDSYGNLNLEAYKKLYDYTLAGMRAAGLTQSLSIANLMAPADGVKSAGGLLISQHTWMKHLAAFLVGKDPSPRNYCPAHLTLPRVNSSQTLWFGFSAYGGDVFWEPSQLKSITSKFMANVTASITNKLEVTVGEGNLSPGEADNRSDATERGGAWNAGVFIKAHEAGLFRYQQWGFTSASHISKWYTPDGVPGAPWSVVQLLSRMEGQTRVTSATTLLTTSPKIAGDEVGAMASRGPENRYFVILYDFNRNLFPTTDNRVENVDVVIDGLDKNSDYRIVHYRIDNRQGTYYNRWKALLGSNVLCADKNVPVAYDALMEHLWVSSDNCATLSTQVTAYGPWLDNRNDFRNQAQPGVFADENLSTVTTNSSGTFTKRITLYPNSVSFLEIATPRTVPSIMPLVLSP
jgi:hypothetical protein